MGLHLQDTKEGEVKRILAADVLFDEKHVKNI